MSELFYQLNEPFPYEEYRVNYEGYAYVSPQNCADRLNQVFGIYNWEHEIVDCEVDLHNFTVSVQGLLKVKDPETGQWVSRSQFGDKKIVVKVNEQQPTPQAILDGKKSAVSDSLKKCAALFGVASDVYRGKIKTVKAKTKDDEYNRMYLALVNYFDLDISYSNQFEHGIIILPDSYRSHYEKNNWNGIFESDKQLAMNYRSRGDKGSTNNKESSELQRDSRALSRNKENKIDEELYEFVNLIADAHNRVPYYKLEFVQKNKHVEVYAKDANVINFIEKLQPKIGKKYKLITEENNRGNLILKRIEMTAS